MADSLPGLGLVAAVLGVVITRGEFGGPPEEIGHKVAAALVGTFLGIFSFLKGSAPIMAVEAARRAIPGQVRPSFQEVEKACRGGGKAAAAAAAAAS
jgi:chemotaxis protein MotA